MGIFRQFPYSNFHEMNMDEIIKIVRELADDWLEYQVKWEHLYEDVDDAFNDLKANFDRFIASCDTEFRTFMNTINVEAELRDALNSMIADGSLRNILVPAVTTVTTSWLEDNITQPTTPVIDASLSIAGAGADARATGHADLLIRNNDKLHGYYHSYNILDYDFIQGYYNYSGQIVSSANHKSYIVPIKNYDKVFYSNANTSIAVLDSSRTWIGMANKTQVSSPIVGTSYNIQAYMFDVSDFYPNAYYVCIPRYLNDFTYLRGATYHKFVPLLPVNPDSTCDEIELVMNNLEIVSPEYYGDLMRYEGEVTVSWHNDTMMNVLTGQMQTQSGHVCSNFIVLKKGTIITCRYSNMAFYLKGMTGSNPIASSANKVLALGADFAGFIDFITAGWEHPGYAPQNVTNLELSYFLEIIPPEELARNKWKGKTWYCFGTSLSDIGVNDTEGNNGYAGKYPLYVDELSRLNRVNRAIGSGGITTDMPHGGNVLQNILQTPYNVDLVTLECLPNDNYENPSHVGEVTDTGTTTICGAFKTACEYITRNTRAKMCVIFVTSYINDPDVPLDNTHTRYVEAKEKLKYIAEMYGVTVIDAEKEAIEYAKRKIGLTYIDHIHLNYLGGKIIGSYVWSKLKNINPYPDFQH